MEKLKGGKKQREIKDGERDLSKKQAAVANECCKVNLSS